MSGKPTVPPTQMQSQTKRWVEFLLSHEVPKQIPFKVGEFIALANKCRSEFNDVTDFPYPSTALKFLEFNNLYVANGKRGPAARWTRIGDAAPEDLFPKSKAPSQPQSEDWFPDWAQRIEAKLDSLIRGLGGVE